MLSQIRVGGVVLVGAGFFPGFQHVGHFEFSISPCKPVRQGAPAAIGGLDKQKTIKDKIKNELVKFYLNYDTRCCTILLYCQGCRASSRVEQKL